MCNHFIAQSTKTRGEFPRQGAALVLFNQQIAAHLAAQAVVDYKPLSMGRVATNVDPDDVIWSSLGMSAWNRRLRGYASFALTAALLVFLTPAVAFVTALVQVKNLAVLSSFGWLRGHKWAFALFAGLVPAALVAVLMAVLPAVLRLLLRLEGTATRSEIELRLMHRLFFFNVWNIYVITILASSAVAITAQAVGNPGELVELIQKRVPESATNILSYVLLLAFMGAAKEILQGVPLALRYIVPRLFAKTPRALFRAETPAAFDWAGSIPQHTLVFVMGVSYSFLAPVVNCFVAVYFGLFYLIYRYQFLYVYSDRHWRQGGLSFPKAVKQMLVGVYMADIYLVLMMVAKFEVSANAILRIVVAVAVLLATVAVHWYIDDVYMPAIKYLPLKRAADVERAPHLASEEIPDIVERAEGSSADEHRRRNWAAIKYGSLAPSFLLRLGLWATKTREKDLEEAPTAIPPYVAPQLTSGSLAVVGRDSRLTLGEEAADLERAFSCPAIRARPVCNLWVPLGNPTLFARLLWEVEYYGQGTILVITEGVLINERGKVCADFDFALKDAEAVDKDGTVVESEVVEEAGESGGLLASSSLVVPVSGRSKYPVDGESAASSAEWSADDGPIWLRRASAAANAGTGHGMHAGVCDADASVDHPARLKKTSGSVRAPRALRICEVKYVSPTWYEAFIQPKPSRGTIRKSTPTLPYSTWNLWVMPTTSNFSGTTPLKSTKARVIVNSHL
ncbi:phosphate metabolism protein 7 [Coemansia aciculifera]|nr:phosphate metabolism protein 7 [Coemansia aciculifera]